MLQELEETRQISGEPRRRWFSCAAIDLIVWYGEADDIVGFQLCYKKGVDEHALTWWQGKGFSHDRIDDGEGLPDSHKMSPILVPDGSFDRDALLGQFRQKSHEVDPEVADFVATTLGAYPGHGNGSEH